jgi:hypothetical protein
MVEIMSDEEAQRLDEYYTSHTPPVGPNRLHSDKNRSFRMVSVDELTAEYLILKTQNTHQTPTEALHELVCREMAYT